MPSRVLSGGSHLSVVRSLVESTMQLAVSLSSLACWPRALVSVRRSDVGAGMTGERIFFASAIQSMSCAVLTTSVSAILKV